VAENFASPTTKICTSSVIVHVLFENARAVYMYIKKNKNSHKTFCDLRDLLIFQLILLTSIHACVIVYSLNIFVGAIFLRLRHIFKKQ